MLCRDVPGRTERAAHEVDACDVGVEAVLLQVGEDSCEKPVTYFSEKLNRHQQVYSTIEKEALALVLAVNYFEVYVASSEKVVVYSDHNPLAFLILVFHWSLVLQPYIITC